MHEIVRLNGYENGPNNRPAYTMRDFTALLFRHKRLIVLSFSGLMLGAILAIVLIPPTYEAEMKIMLEHQRVDPVVSPAINVQQENQDLTPAQVSSEVELIQSRNSLRQVVVALDMYEPHDPWSLGGIKLRVERWLGIAPTKDEMIYEAMLRLEKKIQVTPLIDSNLIQVTYESPYPELAAQVLKELGECYMQEHLALHRPQGAAAFFKKAAQHSKEQLSQVQAQLVEFSQKNQVVSPSAEEQITLEKLGGFQSDLHQTQAAIGQTEQRIEALKGALKSVPARDVSQVHTGLNPQLLQSLKSTLLTLQLKKTNMLQEYKPTYRPVQDVEKQIRETEAAIAKAEDAAFLDQTTDLNPAHQMLMTELLKAETDLAGLKALASSTKETVEDYRSRDLWLNQQAIAKQNLLQAESQAEDNYKLYQAKFEQAQVTDAFDQNHITNVAIAEAAMVPMVPIGLSPFAKLAIAIIVAALLSIGMAFAAEHMNQSFRTPYELESFLELPVLAALPKQGQLSLPQQGQLALPSKDGR